MLYGGEGESSPAAGGPRAQLLGVAGSVGEMIIYYNLMKRKGIVLLLGFVWIVINAVPSALSLYRNQTQLEQNISALTQ